MRSALRMSLCIFLAIFLAAASMPAHAVTWMTVNGATGGIITTPGPITLRCSTSAAGAKVHFVAGSDRDGNGRLGAGEPVFMVLGTSTEGGWTDEDAAPSVLQWSFDLAISVGGPVVVQAVDENGTTVGHVYSMDYAHAAQSVSGTVRYSDGTPGAGLVVFSYMDYGPVTACFTDESGNYTLYLPAGRNALMVSPSPTAVAASRNNRAIPAVDWVDLAPGEARTDEHITMYVGSGPDIAGLVTESDTGHPVPGAVVTAYEQATNEGAVAVADVTGRYSMRAFPGTWTVATDVWDTVGPYGEAPAQDLVVGGGDVAADLVLPRLPNRIYGIVTKAGGVPMTTVGVRAESVSAALSSGTNGLGHYETWVSPGIYTVLPVDGAANYTFFWSGVPHVIAPPSSRIDLTMAPRPYTISGRVTFQGTSTGIAYADVIFAEGTLPVYADLFAATADGQGYYTLKLPPGTFNVHAESWMHDASSASTEITVSANQTRNFSLTPTHNAPTLSAGGVSPVIGAPGQTFTFSVTYTSAQNEPPSDVYVVIDSWPWPMTAVNPGDTNYADGATFRYQAALPAGTHTFWFGTVDRLLLAARFPAAGEMTVIAANSGTLAGTVLAAGTSTPVAGAEVKAYLSDVLKGIATTDAAGAYEIAVGLSTGSYTVIASRDGYLEQSKGGIAVTVGLTTVCDFALTPSGALKGQVTDRGTSIVLAGAIINVYLGGLLKASAVAGADGIYTISRDLPAGTYAVVAAKEGYLAQSKANIAVTAGVTKYVNFFLDRVCLKGQVRIAGTTVNLAGATVAAYQGDVLKATATTDANGIYEVGGLAAGACTVVASRTGYVRQSRPNIVITEGAVTYLNFGLAVSGKLKGQVKDKVSGAPIIGATVVARKDGVTRASAVTTAPYGIYQITNNLPTGTYAVGASNTGYLGQTRKNIGVTAGATTYVNFGLAPGG